MTSSGIGRSDLRDLLVEAINSRDLGVLALAEGVEFPPDLHDGLLRILERRPRTMLTRGDLDGLPVAVVWLPDESERYFPVGHLEIELDAGTPRLSVVDGVDPALTPEAPPGREVAEWESARLWDSGEGNWV